MDCSIGLIMGSVSDWATVKSAACVLEDFNISYEKKIVSAHRTPDLLCQYAKSAHARGIKVIIAAAGGAAHLPGMVAANTILPVLGIPVNSSSLNGMDSLLSIVQMPKGVPVGTLAIGNSGAANAALLAVQILALNNPELTVRLATFRENQTNMVLSQGLETIS